MAKPDATPGQQLEAKLTRKNEVMAELMEAHTLLKKELGEL